MKRNMTRITLIVLSCFFVLTLVINYLLKTEIIHGKISDVSLIYFNQMVETIDKNNEYNELLLHKFEEDTIAKAEQVSFALSKNQDMAFNSEALKELLNVLLIDEINIFSPDGIIINSTRRNHIGMSMDSGEQIGFFKPMLTDVYLTLIQDIAKNTAEDRYMQYAAVWNDEKTYIIQIGQDPISVLNKTSGKSIAHTFESVPLIDNSHIYIIDNTSNKVVAAVDSEHIGKDIDEIGIDLPIERSLRNVFHLTIDGVRYCCNMDIWGQYTFLRMVPSLNTINEIILDIVIYTIFFLLLSATALVTINQFMDKKIIQGVKKINNSLSNIEQGNEFKILNDTLIPELSELSRHINSILQYNQDNYEKISKALEMSQIMMGVVESNGNDKGFMTSRIKDILHLLPVQEEYSQVIEILETILSQRPINNENVYPYTVDMKKYFLRIEQYNHLDSKMFIIIDVTSSILKQQRIEHERDTDALTSLFNRRGFYDKLSELFNKSSELNYSAMILLDMDNLKYINDTYGHPVGDAYIEAMARIVSSLPYPKSLPCRLGGDEFAIFIYGYKHMDELMEAITILKQKGGTQYGDLPAGPVKFSIGFATLPDDSVEFRELMRIADERMYLNKQMKHKA